MEHSKPVVDDADALQKAEPYANSASIHPSPYEYTNLSGTQKEIRLLAIHPGHFDEPIKCRLLSLLLPTHVHFEALSYSCSSSEFMDTIEVDEKHLKVDHDLYTALRYLRLESRRRIMWIDTICINQANAQERSDQLSHLKGIHSSARGVAIWLGDASDSIDKLFSIINTASEAVLSNKEVQNDLSSSSLDEEMENSLIELFNRPWWTEIWGLQAFGFARHCTLICGHNRIPWGIFFKFISSQNTDNSTRILGPRETGISLCSGLNQLRTALKAVRNCEQSHGTPNLPISELMLRFEHYKASDPVTRSLPYSILSPMPSQ